MLLLSNFRSIICKAVAYGRLKRKDNSKFLALNVAAVACERWSLTRGSKYSDMTGKLIPPGLSLLNCYWTSGEGLSRYLTLFLGASRTDFLLLDEVPERCLRNVPALSSKERPRDKLNAIENIDQSANSFQLLWRELHNIDAHSLSTFVAAKSCLSRLCFPFNLAKWITRMPNKGKKEKVMYQASCVSFIFP